MTEAEAAAEAKRLNQELGESRDAGDAYAFYVEVEKAPGEWEVERHVEKPGPVSRVLDAMPLDISGFFMWP
jgi:hypothetical protein